MNTRRSVPLPLSAFPLAERRRVQVVLTDIDDTLTTDGRLTAAAYAALERLDLAGYRVVPVTGRPAGWCDHIARMWPVAAVVGENGAFYFRYDVERHCMERHFVDAAAVRAAKRARLSALGERILALVPGAALAADQHYRETDLAIDFCEDVPALDRAAVGRIVAAFEHAGATAKVSSIHVNGWFGDYDKLGMARRACTEALGIDLVREPWRAVFVGDSPNDAPMFGYFPHAVGVANVRDFLAEMETAPRYVTAARGGAGFAELAAALLE